MNRLIIPVFIPHLGCPHTCVFCNQKKIASLCQQVNPQQVTNIVETYLNSSKCRNGLVVELAFYGGSFTGVDIELQEKLLQLAYDLKNSKKIDAIRMSTRPDYINLSVIQRLKRFTVDTVEIGVQSLNQKVLDKSARGHTREDVIKAVQLLKEANINVGIQLMPGLPGDTEETVLATTKEVIKLRPDFVRIYPTVVIKETKLADLFIAGDFLPWSLERTIEVVAKMYILFSQVNLSIIRMGLQATENLVESRDLIAGPYHPAFGEMVKARVFRKQIEYIVANFFTEPIERTLKLYCHPQEVSQIKGQGKSNIKYFQDKYRLFIDVSPQSSLGRGFLAWTNDEVKACSLFSRREFLDRYRID